MPIPGVGPALSFMTAIDRSAEPRRITGDQDPRYSAALPTISAAARCTTIEIATASTSAAESGLQSRPRTRSRMSSASRSCATTAAIRGTMILLDNWKSMPGRGRHWRHRERPHELAPVAHSTFKPVCLISLSYRAAACARKASNSSADLVTTTSPPARRMLATTSGEDDASLRA
jgi:hypothetical protein